MNKFIKILFSIFIFSILTLSVLSKPENISAFDLLNNQQTVDTQKKITVINTKNNENINLLDVNEKFEAIEEQDAEATINYKKTVKKFLYAMLGVALSSFLLFIGLTIYNKIRLKVNSPIKSVEDKTALASPENINEAVKSFLDATKWV